MSLLALCATSKDVLTWSKLYNFNQVEVLLYGTSSYPAVDSCSCINFQIKSNADVFCAKKT